LGGRIEKRYAADCLAAPAGGGQEEAGKAREIALAFSFPSRCGVRDYTQVLEADAAERAERT